MAASIGGGGGGVGFKRKKGKKEEAELDITPMIDVTFLLLIFFMVTSTMQSQAETNVPPAKHGIGADANESIMITILAEPGGGGGRILLGDNAGDEVTNMELVKAYVQEGINDKKKLVIIKADRDVSHGKVAEVLKALADMEEIQFAIGVQEIR
jgi:biopolymer transport protein ExbD